MAEMHLPHAAGHEENPEVHHEGSDVNVRGIFAFAFGLLVTAVVIHLLVYVLFRYFTAREAHAVPAEFPLAVAAGPQLPPEPRLQTSPRQDLNDLRTIEERVLTTYGWVDKNAGVVRIPIEQAMKLTIERGLPVRKAEDNRR